MHTHFFINTHANTGARTAGPAKVILSLCVRQRDLLADSDILLFPHTAQTDNTTHQHRPWCMLNSCSGSAEERLTSPAAVSNKQTTISETHCQNRQINRTQRHINRQLHKSCYTVRNVSLRNLSQECVALPHNYYVWTKHTQIISHKIKSDMVPSDIDVWTEAYFSEVLFNLTFDTWRQLRSISKLIRASHHESDYLLCLILNLDISYRTRQSRLQTVRTGMLQQNQSSGSSHALSVIALIIQKQ